MLRISPHLRFNGQCREAFVRYQAVLGGTLTTLLTYGESPRAGQFDIRWHGLILHATRRLGALELMGADQTPDSYCVPQGIYISHSVPTAEQGRTIFAGLAEGGQITLPFGSTFWPCGFGMLVDAFGIPWEINSDSAPATAAAQSSML